MNKRKKMISLFVVLFLILLAFFILLFLKKDNNGKQERENPIKYDNVKDDKEKNENNDKEIVNVSLEEKNNTTKKKLIDKIKIDIKFDNSPTNEAIVINLDELIKETPNVNKNDIKKIKYLFGVKNKEHFVNQGIEIEDKIEIMENSILTIFIEYNNSETYIEYIEINNIDKIAPKITINKENKYVNKETVISLNVKDDQDVNPLKKYSPGIKDISYFENNGEVIDVNTLKIKENSYYTFYAKDKAGNETIEVVEISNIDKTLPIINSSFNSNWTNKDININFSASDLHSGLEIKKYLNGVKNTNDFKYEGKILTSDNFNISNNGLYTLYAKDKAGNESIKIIDVKNIDKKIPTINQTYNKNWVKKELEVNTGVSDIDSGINVVKYLSGNKKISDFDKNGTIIKNNLLKVNSNGTYTIYAKDNAGNEAIKTITIDNIDNSKPVINTSFNTNWVKDNINITFQAIDFGSGINVKKIANGNKTSSFFENQGNVVNGNTFNISNNGLYTLYAKDNAGNETISVIEINNIDKESPIFNINQIGLMNGVANIKVDIFDLSPIAVKKYTKGIVDAEYFENSGTTFSTNVDLTLYGIYTFYAKDSSGNYSISYYQPNFYDPNLPYKYLIDGLGRVTIEEYLGTEGDVIIPSLIEGRYVTKLEEDSFKNKNLNSIVIPDTVTEIGDEAFRNNILTSVTLGDLVVEIGEYAFENNRLSSVVIPNSVISIGEKAFRNNNITNLILGNKVTNIDDYAFRNNQITSVILPNSVTNIGKYVFRENKITSVIIPDSVTNIDDYAFADNELTTVVIPSSVRNIGDYAFRNNKLTSIVLGNSIENIGNYAFEDNKLTTVVIPNSVINIDDYAFQGNKITSLVLGNSVTNIGKNVFRDNKLTSVVIPDSVTNIGNGAFKENQITFLVLGNKVTNIGDESFKYNKLTSVVIPDSVTNIGNEAFQDNNLISVILGNSLTNIGNFAFRKNKITSIVIPNSVRNIGDYAFTDNEITSVVLGNSVRYIGIHAFTNNDLTIVVIPDSVTSIGENAFFYNVNLKNVYNYSSINVGPYFSSKPVITNN